MVPLLFQLRRTAQAIDEFVISSKKDLSQITEDVRASRLRVNHLAGSLQTALDDLSSLTGLLKESAVTVNSFNARVNTTLDSASRKFTTLFGGVGTALAFLKNLKPPSTPE